MKNISILILLVSIMAVFAVAAFLLKQESRYSALTYSDGRSVSTTAAELRKTEVALHEIERLQLSGNFSLSAPDDLLSARSVPKQVETARFAAANNENVFPVFDDGNRRDERAGVSRFAELLSKGTAQPNYIGSGYTTPVVVNRTQNEAMLTKEPAVQEPIRDLHHVSFIYVSPDIRRAIVNGVFVQEGESLSDGSRVTAINNDHVVISKNKKEYSFSVPQSLSTYSESGRK